MAESSTRTILKVRLWPSGCTSRLTAPETTGYVTDDALVRRGRAEWAADVVPSIMDHGGDKMALEG